MGVLDFWLGLDTRLNVPKATRINFRAAKFPWGGGGGMPPDPPRGYASHALNGLTTFGELATSF